MAIIDAQAATASSNCKTEGCPGESVASRGPFAGLCTDCAGRRRGELSARARAANAGAAIAFGERPAGAPAPAPGSPVAIARELTRVARDLERAQHQHRASSKAVSVARRQWAQLLRDAAAAGGLELR